MKVVTTDPANVKYVNEVLKKTQERMLKIVGSDIKIEIDIRG